MCSFFFFNETATTEIYTLSLHDALPISSRARLALLECGCRRTEPAERRCRVRCCVHLGRARLCISRQLSMPPYGAMRIPTSGGCWPGLLSGRHGRPRRSPSLRPCACKRPTSCSQIKEGDG